VSWNDKENCSGRSKTETKVGDFIDIQGWQVMEVKGLMAPTGTHSAHVELIQSVAGKGKFAVYWDDVYFKAVSN